MIWGGNVLTYSYTYLVHRSHSHPVAHFFIFCTFGTDDSHGLLGPTLISFHRAPFRNLKLLYFFLVCSGLHLWRNPDQVQPKNLSGFIQSLSARLGSSLLLLDALLITLKRR
ncbi:uncharacterized protein LAJ45_04106 [Morchella importuna]|uniref:uncharacterized protein n=1 Tax=Morchella importuna TaxID=1174673 RepID=UPI001E8E7EA6|nr:uncharacterized protein LAJ45_04106 [Morchella importuna]KAH8152112.1 hypothetical protein LAJ45_04106 [Morchella importuna]